MCPISTEVNYSLSPKGLRSMAKFTLIHFQPRVRFEYKHWKDIFGHQE